MRKIGFVFRSAPHGNAAGREGLDALLAASNYTDNIAVFFIGDGVMQLLCNQNPNQIYCRDYIAAFAMLPLCDVDEYYVCQTSLEERGLSQIPLQLDASVTSSENIRAELASCSKVLVF